MDFDVYQEKAIALSLYPRKDITFPALGLNGEAGEVAEHAKKIYRDDEGKITSERREKLLKELGDVLWYLSACAHSVDLPLSEIAEANLNKLYDRKERGVLSGSGSDR